MDYDEKRILDLEASVAQIKTLLQKLIGPEPEPEPESPEPEPEPIDMPFPAKPAPAEVPPPAILPMTRAEEIAEDKAERARLDSMPESKALLVWRPKGFHIYVTIFHERLDQLFCCSAYG